MEYLNIFNLQIIPADSESSWLGNSLLFIYGHIDLGDLAFNCSKVSPRELTTIMAKRWNI